LGFTIAIRLPALLVIAFKLVPPLVRPHAGRLSAHGRLGSRGARVACPLAGWARAWRGRSRLATR
jgi:hypothetical protein